MSFTPQKPKNIACKNRKNMNNHEFTIEEINEVFVHHTQGILIGSAAVWLYAEYYGVPHVGLTGVGSDIDILEDPWTTGSDILVSEDGQKCRENLVFSIRDIHY